MQGSVIEIVSPGKIYADGAVKEGVSYMEPSIGGRSMSYDFAFDKKSVFLILGGSALIGVLLFFAGFVVGWDRGTYQARLDFEKQNAASNASLAKAKPPEDAVATPVAMKSDTTNDAGSADDPPPATQDEAQKAATAPEPQTAVNSSVSEPEKKQAKDDPAAAPQEKPAVQSSQKAPAPATASSAGAPDADKTADASDDPSGFSLQIGAFQNEDNALRCVSSFKSRGYAVFVFHTLDARGHTWHTVRIGHYPSVDKAAAAAAVFKGKEKMPVFIRPVNEL